MTFGSFTTLDDSWDGGGPAPSFGDSSEAATVPVMRKVDREALDSAYRRAGHEVSTAIGHAIAEAHAEIASGNAPLNPALTAGKVIDAAKAAIEGSVDALIAAHLAAADTDVDAISIRLRAFVESRQCPSIPSARARNPGVEMRSQALAKATFEGARASIGSGVKDRVALALLNLRAETTLVQRLQKRAANHPIAAVVILIFIVLAAVRGVLGFVMDVRGMLRGTSAPAQVCPPR